MLPDRAPDPIWDARTKAAPVTSYALRQVSSREFEQIVERAPDLIGVPCIWCETFRGEFLFYPAPTDDIELVRVM